MQFNEKLTAMVIARVVEGYRKESICDELDISADTVNQILSSINDWQVRKIWYKYKDDEFCYISFEQLHDFLRADCNYRKYRLSRSFIGSSKLLEFMKEAVLGCHRLMHSMYYRHTVR